MSAALTLATPSYDRQGCRARQGELASLLQAATRKMGFRYYALVHHTELRTGHAGVIDLKHYLAAIIGRLVAQQRCRRDPIIRACFFAGTASSTRIAEMQPSGRR